MEIVGFTTGDGNSLPIYHIPKELCA
ncbi:uncharacterized protein METZ01_LOCUS166005 [marine metagenome]|uniref:Uncharacterized protein n=1 Tax=marine metagenome TaxID=408172 RepID=A0A382BI21_9ZZZZ